MYPDLFGINGFSMVVMILLGFVFATILLFIYLHYRKVDKSCYLDVLLIIVGTALMGMIGTILFENLYEAIKSSIYHTNLKWTWGMTFYGGLVFGVPTFILIYKFYFLRHNSPIMDKVLIIAPASITLGHAIGRIGCFLSGCCYGVDTDSSIGILFPGHDHKVLPTQLIECAFLLLLSACLIYLAFKRNFLFNFVIYIVFYGIFRFIIEFFRGDERGQLNGLSPSQYWCIVLVILAVPLYFFLKNYYVKKVEENNHNEI